MILQFRQIFFTDANTFMSVSGRRPAAPHRRATGFVAASVRCCLLPDLCSYFARNVILALDKSYGVSSTVTLSPGRILM